MIFLTLFLLGFDFNSAFFAFFLDSFEELCDAWTCIVIIFPLRFFSEVFVLPDNRTGHVILYEGVFLPSLP